MKKRHTEKNMDFIDVLDIMLEANLQQWSNQQNPYFILCGYLSLFALFFLWVLLILKLTANELVCTIGTLSVLNDSICELVKHLYLEIKLEQVYIEHIVDEISWIETKKPILKSVGIWLECLAFSTWEGFLYLTTLYNSGYRFWFSFK